MRRMNGSAGRQDRDFLAAEEPLEIRIEGHSVAVVMRTPGEDHELAAGFLVTEGLVHAASDLVDIRHRSHCFLSARDGGLQREEVIESASGEGVSRTEPEMSLAEGNVIDVRLRQPASLDLKRLTRHVFSSSSCGICSKASIEAVRPQFPPIEEDFEVEPQVLIGLPAALTSVQE